MTFFAGLLLTSFVINILFKLLALSSDEHYLLKTIRVKKKRKEYAAQALVVIQRVVRRFLIGQELRMLKAGGGGRSRTFTTSSQLKKEGWFFGARFDNFGKSNKPPTLQRPLPPPTNPSWRPMQQRRMTMLSDDEKIESVRRMQVMVKTSMNLSLFDWRAIRQKFNNLETAAFDAEEGMRNVDARTGDIEKMLVDLHRDMSLIGGALKLNRPACAGVKPYIKSHHHVEKATNLLEVARMLQKKKAGARKLSSVKDFDNLFDSSPRWEPNTSALQDKIPELSEINQDYSYDLPHSADESRPVLPQQWSAPNSYDADANEPRIEVTRIGEQGPSSSNGSYGQYGVSYADAWDMI